MANKTEVNRDFGEFSVVFSNVDLRKFEECQEHLARIRKRLEQVSSLAATEVSGDPLLSLRRATQEAQLSAYACISQFALFHERLFYSSVESWLRVGRECQAGE